MIIKTLKQIKRNFIPFSKMLFYNSICKGWIEMFGKHDKRIMKYRV